MRVLITGASGFIGRRLVSALCESIIEVKVLSRYESVGDLFYNCPQGKIIPVIADMTRAASLDRVCDDVDGVFHLAGYAHAVDANGESAAAIHRRVTIDGTRALLEQARRAGVTRFVYASSVKAVGEGSEQCIDETAVASPVNEYGRSKLEAEQLVLATGREFGMHVCVLRLPLVYGPGVKGNLLQMMRAIDTGRFPPPPGMCNRRSLVHVDDVVTALRLAMEHPRADGEIYLVTDGRAYSTRAIYELMCRALGRTAPRWAVPVWALRTIARIGDAIGHMRGRPFFFNSVALDKLLGSAWYNSGKIERELGFKSTHTLETAVPAMVEEYRKRVETV